MLKRIVLFILGIVITSYSLMFIIIYLNLIKMGYSFIEYIKYIFTNIECNLIFVGIILICLSFKNKYNSFSLVNTISRRLK